MIFVRFPHIGILSFTTILSIQNMIFVVGIVTWCMVLVHLYVHCFNQT